MRKFAVVLLGVAVLTGCQTKPIVPQDAWVQKVSTGYRFTEGPVFDGQGAVYFTDIPNQRIIKFDIATKRESVFRENSGGANGLFFDPQGRLVICEGLNRRVTRLEKDGTVTVLATNTPFGNRLNRPNDLVIDSRGGIYFTDPTYGMKEAEKQYGKEGVFYISPGTPSTAAGAVRAIAMDLQRPNGIILSNDEKTLYVADHGAKTIVAYDITAPGQVANKRIFCSLDPNKGGVDGMAIDKKGNIYGAAQGQVLIWNPKGALIASIPVLEAPSNCTFADDELYITARTSLYKVKLNASGGAGGR